MLAGRSLGPETEALLASLRRMKNPVWLVSNEVGLGIVPENALARRFRDEAGRLHRQLAAQAEHVVLMVAGLPLTVK
jgi:adenosylcobinamide kinase/adenosylcobinamide-phosphate guanylyltransferase